MRYLFITFLFSSFLFTQICAQKISGKIHDETKNPLEYASIVLLNAADSSMLEFSHSDRKGEFTLYSNKKVDQLLQISFLGYETIWQSIPKSDVDIVLEPISLKISFQILDEIEIKDYLSPMSYGKDTIQYNAAAFKIKPGDVVEDLLRKLPGVEVERDGSVKALGEKVQNVLVDGKEFFGKDTKIATKNLDADAIDKIQLFDRKSDRSEFTGIDDGQKERSINLKLKEDKKIGYFGTAEFAGGNEGRYKARANINQFRNNIRTSFIGLANNINEQNFSINDYIEFMGGIGALMSGSGGRFTIDLNQNSGLPIGLANNQGIQNSMAAGLNLNSDFSKKTSLEASVFGNHINNNLLRHSTQENLLPENRFTNDSREHQISTNSSGSYSLRLKSKFDSTQNLVLKSTGSFGLNNINSEGEGKIFDFVPTLLNENSNDFDMEDTNFRILGDFLWQKKTKKQGRTYSFNGTVNFSKNNSESKIASIYKIYAPLFQTNQLLQNQFGLDNGLYYKMEGSYTEPLSKKQYLEFRSSLANQNNKTSSDYYDIVNENPIYNLLLSTLYQRDYSQRNFGINYSLAKEKYNLTLGSRFKHSTLNGIVQEAPNKIQNNFKAILPSAYFTYRFGLSENLNFNYFSELNEPSLQQLQPAANNNNPLAVFIGNPKLRPEQLHNTNISYMRYSAFNFTMFYASLQLNYTHDKITESLNIDSSLVRIYTPVNVKNESTITGRFEYDTPIRPLKIKARMILRGNYNQNLTVINDEHIPTQKFGYGYNFSLENRNKDVVDIIVGIRVNQSQSGFSQNQELNQSYTEKTLYSELGINIKDWFSLKSSLDYLSVRTSLTENQTVIPIWTASATFFLTKNKKLRANLSCFDLLQKNKGFITNSQSNYTDIVRTNVLGRYVMLGLAYNIKGFKKPSGVIINVGGRE
ncbi:MAG: TonB-dependent receptor [Saprospiraceae bacterium]|nr:TonB-dependent receptor [Saprospiraceae bacterium]